MPVPFIFGLAAAAPTLVDAGFRIAGHLTDDSTNDKTRASKGSTQAAGLARATRAQGRQTLRPSPPNAPSSSTRPAGPPAFDAEQRAALVAIATEVQRAALPPALAASRSALVLALVVNAWAESRLRPTARNRTGSEDSVGLFQANRKEGLGTGRSVAELSDPRMSTRIVLAEVVRQGARFEALLRAGATVPQLAGAFTLWVEKPANPTQRAQERAQLLAQWFPTLASATALQTA